MEVAVVESIELQLSSVGERKQTHGPETAPGSFTLILSVVELLHKDAPEMRTPQ